MMRSLWWCYVYKQDIGRLCLIRGAHSQCPLPYMNQPEGFEVGGLYHVCLLEKLLYESKEASRGLNETLHSVLTFMGIQQVQSVSGLYIHFRNGVRLLLPVFVDDLMLSWPDGAKIDLFVQELFCMSTWEIWDPPHSTLLIKYWGHLAALMDLRTYGPLD